MSNETKWTPGPWQVLERGQIAACDESGEWEPTMVGVTPGWSEGDRVMAAAAPELYEALQEACVWDSHDEEGVPAVWLGKARAALAKARGETDAN